MGFEILLTNSYEKDLARVLKRSNFRKETLKRALLQIENGFPTDFKSLKGKYKNMKEVRVTGDYRLLFKYDFDEETISLIRLGTHSDLF